MPLDPTRARRLARALLSPEVRTPEPAHAEEVPALLTEAQVKQVFINHVPGVQEFLFRGHPGQLSLKFIANVYRDGWRAFMGTSLHLHLLWLMRLVVHRGLDGGPEVARSLTEVAEAFQDCQAVQARAVERVGLRLMGVSADLKGLTTRLVGEYKGLALKMLAADRLAQGLAMDRDAVPTHYENRLTADVGPFVGADPDDVRRAALDGHAAARFPALTDRDARAAARRCRELFDVEALLAAFAAEVNVVAESMSVESLPALFLAWASEHIPDKHALLDEETCTRADIDAPVALCVFEALFLGAVDAPASEQHRGVPLRELFAAFPPIAEVAEEGASGEAAAEAKRRRKARTRSAEVLAAAPAAKGRRRRKAPCGASARAVARVEGSAEVPCRRKLRKAGVPTAGTSGDLSCRRKMRKGASVGAATIAAASAEASRRRKPRKRAFLGAEDLAEVARGRKKARKGAKAKLEAAAEEAE